MKTFEKILLCLLVILIAVTIGYLKYTKDTKKASGNDFANSNLTTDKDKNATNTNNQNTANKNENYVGEEEKVGKDEENNTSNEQNTSENGNQGNDTQTENNGGEVPETNLTGTAKAEYIVKNKYALEGQTVAFDHMEGSDYVVRINNGTAVTWYLVDGTTWEAQEY